MRNILIKVKKKKKNKPKSPQFWQFTYDSSNKFKHIQILSSIKWEIAECEKAFQVFKKKNVFCLTQKLNLASN